MEFTFQRMYRGPLKAVLLDWAGTTMDYGCFAPAVVFMEVFKRKGVEITKRHMLKVFEEHRVIASFRAMQKIVGGTTAYNLLAWQELLRSGEIVKCIGGYSLPGIAKHVNELMAEGRYRAKLRAPVGDEVRRKYVEDAKTLLTKLEARLLGEKKQ